MHATLFRFNNNSVTRPPTHATPCHALAHGSPTPQFRRLLHLGPLHRSKNSNKPLLSELMGTSAYPASPLAGITSTAPSSVNRRGRDSGRPVPTPPPRECIHVSPHTNGFPVRGLTCFSLSRLNISNISSLGDVRRRSSRSASTAASKRSRRLFATARASASLSLDVDASIISIESAGTIPARVDADPPSISPAYVSSSASPSDAADAAAPLASPRNAYSSNRTESTRRRRRSPSSSTSSPSFSTSPPSQCPSLSNPAAAGPPGPSSLNASSASSNRLDGIGFSYSLGLGLGPNARAGAHAVTANTTITVITAARRRSTSTRRHRRVLPPPHPLVPRLVVMDEMNECLE